MITDEELDRMTFEQKLDLLRKLHQDQQSIIDQTRIQAEKNMAAYLRKQKIIEEKQKQLEKEKAWL